MGTEKIAKTAKRAASAMSGKWGILNRLEAEHAEVSALMGKVLEASSQVQAAQKHYPTIRKNLLLHASAEEQVFYTACEAREELEISDLIPSSRAEHDEIERIIGELDATPMDSPHWIEQFKSLQRAVQEHVADEEDRLFERAKEAFEASALRDLDEQYVSTKDQLELSLAELPISHQEQPHIP
jgi:hemerythrin superfamily protein